MKVLVELNTKATLDNEGICSGGIYPPTQIKRSHFCVSTSPKWKQSVSLIPLQHRSRLYYFQADFLHTHHIILKSKIIFSAKKITCRFVQEISDHTTFQLENLKYDLLCPLHVHMHAEFITAYCISDEFL